MGYLGSKAASGVFQAIIALMPPHETFIDLYVGSGAILLRKPEAVHSYAVDLNRSMVDRLPDSPRLTKICGRAQSFIDTFDWARSGRVLIYADPPYLHSTRSSRSRYDFEMTDTDHLAMLQQLRCVPASVILSGYPSEMYDANLPGWHTREFQAMTRGGVRTEKVWFNFDPVTAYSTAYVGRNFTDRQRIKRKAARWKANYAALPPGERLAILSAILSAGIDGDGDDAGRIERSVIAESATLGRRPQMALSLSARVCHWCGHEEACHERTDPQSCFHETDGEEDCECFCFSPMPDSGVTKLSPHESAERSGDDAR